MRVLGFSSSCVETSGRSLCWCESVSLLSLILQPEGLPHLKVSKISFLGKINTLLNVESTECLSGHCTWSSSVGAPGRVWPVLH